MLDENKLDAPKSSSAEKKRSISGQRRTKKSSSRNKQATIMAEARPISTPSFFRKRTIKLLPPTEEGVTAEVNSQSTFTLKTCRHERA